MTKKTFLATVAALTLLAGTVQAQNYEGYRTSNYAGVNAVYSNPAFIADSRYKVDINLVGINASVANSQAKFNLGDINNTFKSDSIKNQLFGTNPGQANALVNLTVNGPAVLFHTPGKLTWAVTTRARVVGNVSQLDGKLVDKVINDLNNDPNLPYTINSSNNQVVNVSGWTEWGISAAREVYARGAHHFTAGVTLKYLAGSGNAHLGLDNFKGTINADLIKQDAYLNNTTGRMTLGFSGVNFSDFQAGDLTKFNGHGIGGDLGITYEWRPIGSKDYKLRIGAAVTDIGHITYDRDMARSGDYKINIPANQAYYLSNLNGVSLDNYASTLANDPVHFQAQNATATSYTVHLPTMLQLDADLHIIQHFAVNLASQMAFAKNENKPYNSAYYSNVTLTPRYENRYFGAFLPLNYNDLSKFNAGAAFRVGPMYIGSGSVLSSLMSDSKQLDVFIGFHIWLGKRK